MQVKIKRVDISLPLPRYYTKGSVGFDMYAREDTLVPSHKIARIPTNLIIEVPSGFMLYVKDRSSTATKGLIATAGIIDQDFCGPNDEILFQVYNYTDQDVKVSRGQRLAQGIFVAISQVEWAEKQENIKEESRGGFGSSG